MRWSIVLPGTVTQGLDEVSRRAEDAGIHRLWTTDTPGRDAILRSSYVLSATKTLRSGTGIAYAFSRGPLATAGMASDAFALSGGRFALGLGAGTRGQRRWYDQPFEHPAPRFADYVRATRAVLTSGGSVSYEGSFYDLKVPRVHLAASAEELGGLEIFGGGLHERMLKAIAESCDGLVLHPLAGWAGYLEDVVHPAIRHPVRPDGSTCRLIVWCPLSIDVDPADARSRAAEQLAFYFSTPSYHDIADRAGFGEAAGSIVEAYRGGQESFAELAKLIPGEMLDHFVVHGDPETVAEKLSQRRAAWTRTGVEEVALQVTTHSMTRDVLEESLTRIFGMLPDLGLEHQG
jgi:alkanesulfonate monooxygenase SsuD/methylene tetrahydromethanopterin reductase-like flavin-dependent oxidoreductase (luciferase family)